MNDKDKLRKIKTLMYKHPFSYSFSTESKTREIVFDNYNQHKDSNFKSKIWWSSILELVKIYTLCDELTLTDDEILTIWREVSRTHAKNKKDLNKKPIPEGRDNKDVHVGGGGSNRNKIRYPSKKRSLRTWKKFYKLFPYAAMADGFDGKTSKRMK